MKKKYFTYNDIHETVKKLSKNVLESSFKPDVLLAIGSGGLIAGRILKTFIPLPLYVVSVNFYQDEKYASSVPFELQWLDKPEEQIQGKNVLIVDEVDDSRATLEYCCNRVLEHQPKGIGMFVLHNKDKEKKGIFPPSLKHYFFGEELPKDLWSVYPWEVEGCITTYSESAKK